MSTAPLSSLTAAILTISDRGAAGLQRDESGPALVERLAETWPELEIEARAVMPDDPTKIQRVLQEWADQRQIALILTTGGTGFAPRDQTPEAVAPLIERLTPGLVQAMLSRSLAITPHAMLSRPVAGIRGRSLIVTLPGSPKGALENLDALLVALPHGLGLLRGEATDHDAEHPQPPSEGEETS